jgi:hypothetical protein
MLSSHVRTFTDSDDYGASIRGTKAELTVTARGSFAAKLHGSTSTIYGCSGFPITFLGSCTRRPGSSVPASHSERNGGRLFTGAAWKCSHAP